MNDQNQEVTMTKKFLVNDRETLAEWLNQRLADFLADEMRDGETSKSSAGSKALDLIEEAGFKLTPPNVVRKPVELRKPGLGDQPQ